MPFDTEEWRRPWTMSDEAASRSTAAASVTPGTPSGTAGAAAVASGATGSRTSPFAPPDESAETPGAVDETARPDDGLGPSGSASVAARASTSSPRDASSAPDTADGATTRSRAWASTGNVAFGGSTPHRAPNTDHGVTGFGALPTPAPAAANDGSRTRGPVAFALVGALLGSAIGTGVTYALVRDDAPAPVAQPTFPQVAPTVPAIDPGTESGLPVVAAVAAAVTPSVVRIDVINAFGNPQGLGSGVIYRSDGYVLTNNHVVQGAGGLVVRLANGDRLEATLVGTDPLNDLAVLRVDRVGLPAIQLREDAVRVGETAIAIGSPFGLDATVTAGVVSAVSRDIDVPDDGSGVTMIFDVLQTDAAINPGNSGGALVDAQGRLIGVNAAILTDTGVNDGVGFAIPALTADRSARQLIAQGEVTYAYLGVSGGDLTPELAEQFGLDNERGALIGTVEPGTGADEAGMLPQDIIVSIDGEPIDSMADLVVAIRKRDVGDVLVVLVIRDGVERRLQVELGERPNIEPS